MIERLNIRKFSLVDKADFKLTRPIVFVGRKQLENLFQPKSVKQVDCPCDDKRQAYAESNGQYSL